MWICTWLRCIYKTRPAQSTIKIFEPFFTTKPPGSGKGLELSISYDLIIKGHGGKLEVISEKREGASLCIVLPV